MIKQTQGHPYEIVQQGNPPVNAQSQQDRQPYTNAGQLLKERFGTPPK
jgi:hypothetical protein